MRARGPLLIVVLIPLLVFFVMQEHGRPLSERLLLRNVSPVILACSQFPLGRRIFLYAWLLQYVSLVLTELSRCARIAMLVHGQVAWQLLSRAIVFFVRLGRGRRQLAVFQFRHV